MKTSSLLWAPLAVLLILAGCQSATDEEEIEPPLVSISTASDSSLAKLALAMEPMGLTPDSDFFQPDGTYSYSDPATNITYVGTIKSAQTNVGSNSEFSFTQTMASTPTSEAGTTVSGKITAVIGIAVEGSLTSSSFSYKGTLTLSGVTSGTVAFELSWAAVGSGIAYNGNVTIDGTRYGMSGYENLPEE